MKNLYLSNKNVVPLFMGHSPGFAVFMHDPKF